MSSEYFWPILKPNEITPCLNQCQLHVTDNDIKHPNKDTLLEIYVTLCLLIAGDRAEDFDTINTNALESAGITKLELYQEGICELNIYRSISKLMNAASIPNFSMQNDIFEATGERTIFNLSGLMNFAKFRELRLQFYSQLTQESDELILQKEQKLEEQELLKKELKQLQEESEINRPIIQNLISERSNIGQQVNDLNHKQTELRDESTRLKHQNQEIIERIESIHTVIETTEQQTSRLRNGIIDKPEEAIELINNLRDKIKNEQKLKSSTETKNLHIRTKLEQLSKLHKEVEKCLELLDKVKQEWDNSKQSNKENKIIQTSINEIKQKRKDAQRNMELNKKQQTLANERLERSINKYSSKLDILLNEKKEIENQYSLSLKHINTDLHDKIEDYKTKTKELDHLLQLEQNEHHIFMTTLENQMDNLYTQVGELHHQILEKIDNFNDI